MRQQGETRELLGGMKENYFLPNEVVIDLPARQIILLQEANRKNELVARPDWSPVAS